jgi:hypothetical protein
MEEGIEKLEKSMRRRVAELEERMLRLEGLQGIFPETEKNVVEIDLTLPEDDIDGLHFNETKVHSVFEEKEDGAYYSRDILFLSARDTDERTKRDLLSEYLNKHEQPDGIKEQIAIAMKVDLISYVEVFLPEKNQGVKRYNGVSCWYWIRPRDSDYSDYVRNVGPYGRADISAAAAVRGCAPAFRIKRG